MTNCGTTRGTFPLSNRVLHRAQFCTSKKWHTTALPDKKSTRFCLVHIKKCRNQSCLQFQSIDVRVGLEMLVAGLS